MTFDNPAQVLQMLDGRKLHVLIALFVLAEAGSLPCSEMDVSCLVGCDRGTARRTLEKLAALGLAGRGSFKSKSSWTLTSEAHQLPLPLRQLSGNHAGTAVLASGEVRISPHGATTTTLNIEERSAIPAAAAEDAPREVRNAPHGEKLSTGYPQNSGGVVAALHRFGVGWPTDAELAGLDWVDVAYVEAHGRLMRDNGDRVALMVHRIRSGDRMPVFDDGRCACGAKLFNGACLVCEGVIQR